jgi:hypothetical protein
MDQANRREDSGSTITRIYCVVAIQALLFSQGSLKRAS